MFTVPLRLPGAEAAAARIMGNAWASYYAALLQGDPSASAFAEWLAGYWQPDLDRPAGAPDARATCASEAGRIDWFERGDWVSGHIAGTSGGYRIPRAEVLAHAWITPIETAA